MWAGNVVGFSEASDVISVDLSSQEGTDIQIARLATFFNNLTVFENRPKSRIQHCERSELRLHLKKNAKNGPFWRLFEKLKHEI